MFEDMNNKEHHSFKKILHVNHCYFISMMQEISIKSFHASNLNNKIFCDVLAKYKYFIGQWLDMLGKLDVC